MQENGEKGKWKYIWNEFLEISKGVNNFNLKCPPYDMCWFPDTGAVLGNSRTLVMGDMIDKDMVPGLIPWGLYSHPVFPELSDSCLQIQCDKLSHVLTALNSAMPSLQQWTANSESELC